MKKVLIGIAALVVLLIVAIIAIPLFVPLETFKDDIAAEAEAATGRKLDIAGDLSLSVFPSVAIKVGGVTYRAKSVTIPARRRSGGSGDQLTGSRSTRRRQKTGSASSQSFAAK